MHTRASYHDSTAWACTALAEAIDAGRLPKEIYIIGDEALGCTEQHLTPWPGRGIDRWKDSLNYHSSRMRQYVERVSGLFTKRWGVFWRPLRCDAAGWASIVMVCCKLHNLCVENSIPYLGTLAADHRVDDRVQACTNSDVLGNSFPRSR
jgi:hypothetical protein